MFIGEFQHSIDEKGRIAVPSKFRTVFKGGVIITRGLERCLFVFGKKEWDIFAKRINALPISQSNSRAFGRFMLGGAMEVRFDVQGRINVPDYLRDYAGLKKQVIIAGLYSRLEIWDKESWKKYKNKTEASSDDVAERLGELGI